MTSILGSEWHISAVGNDILTENNSIKDKQKIYNVALNTDLKEICKPILHEITNTETPKLVLQIHKIRNISAPKANEESQAAPRMLKLTLTDGETYIQGLELSHIPTINLKNTPPGTKLLLEKVKLISGYLLLTPQNCKVLGGRVESLIEKWEPIKNVQRNRRNNESGAPPWVNLGIKIKTANQENFKSLVEKPKDLGEASEFDQQRKDAIAEASSGAVRKIFSGRVRQNVQVQSANNKNFPDKFREKKEFGKPKGKNLIREKEVDEKPQKPLEKVSLFAFLEDKLPVISTQDNFYQSRPSRNSFKEIEYTAEDQNKYDYKRKKTPLPKQFEKPDYNKNQETNASKQNFNNTQNSYNYIDTSQKKPSDNSFNKSKENFNFPTNDQYKQKSNYYAQKTNTYSQNNLQINNPNLNRSDQFKQKSYPQQNNTPSQQDHPYPQQNHSYPLQNNSYPQQKQLYPQQNRNYPKPSNYYPQQNSYPSQSNSQNSNFTNQPYQRPSAQNDVNHITQGVQKIALNNQFASKTLRQQLNLDIVKKNEDGPGKSEEMLKSRMNVGDEIMAKYWEDGKYYNATIISITDKTFAVRFKGYGNIEEILKTDCQLSLHSNNTRLSSNQQGDDRSNKQYSGSSEYRRRNYK